MACALFTFRPVAVAVVPIRNRKYAPVPWERFATGMAVWDGAIGSLYIAERPCPASSVPVPIGSMPLHGGTSHR